LRLVISQIRGGAAQYCATAFNFSKEELMNSDDPGPSDGDHHCCDTRLHLSAAKLDVYRHERLAYAEPPQKISRPRTKVSKGTAILKAMAAWALAHL
jgi:hypothetical protein